MKKNITNVKKTFIILLVLVGLAISTKIGYPVFRNYFKNHSSSTHFYQYTPKNIKPEADLTGQPPAIAVPILMYHGIVSVTDTENTDIPHFIDQMEMLKRQGYQTITLENLDDFIHGKFTLPPRPIVITFDDGRKDSYFPTDEIFRKLGFKATLFEVSGKANDKDSFYLNWDDLKEMYKSGRWDIQAHGTYSHTKIVIDDKGTIGRFLSSREYFPGKGIENEKEFQARVENDYIKNIKDIHDNLGYTPKYFAIPLNDYGQRPSSNYPESIAFNQDLIKKYFNQAYVEVNDSENVKDFHYSVFNYQNADPYKIGRIEVKNLSAAELKRQLDLERPGPPTLTLGTNNVDEFKNSTKFDYGSVFNVDSNGLRLISSVDTPSSRVHFGETHWSNYTVEMTIQRMAGSSVVLIACLSDNKDYISFGVTRNSAFLKQTINDIDTQLARPVAVNLLQQNIFKLAVINNTANGFLNGRLIFSNISVKLSEGMVGFKVWDESGIADGILKSVVVYPTK